MSEYGSNEREVIDWKLGQVMAKLEAVNKRAKRNGVAPFRILVSAGYERGRKMPDGTLSTFEFDTYYKITVEGDPVVVEGFKFIGRVDFEEGDRIVSTVPGEEMPLNFREATMACWHCRTERRRGAVFIFRHVETGKHMQVGRSCLQDFMKKDPAAVLWSAALFTQLMEDIDEEMRGGGHVSPLETSISWVRFLELACLTIRKDGFMSKRKAREIEEGGGFAPLTTSMNVFDLLFGTDHQKNRLKVEAEDTERAEKILTWLRDEWAAKPEAKRSDYEHNVMTLLERDTIKAKRFGLAAVLPVIYARAMEERQANKGCPNEHVGEIGERRAFEAVFRGETMLTSDYGTFYIGRFATAEGLLVYKGASPFWDNGLENGAAIKFVGTIDKHDDYKGTKQTKVTRCKVFTGDAPKIGKRKAAKAAPAPAANGETWKAAA